MDHKEIPILEFLELFPKNLQLLGDIEGEKIFSNELIINYVYSMLNKNKVTSGISDSLKLAIENNIILIGFAKKSSIPFLFRKMKNWAFSHYNNSFAIAFYSKQEKKIAIILDQNVNILGMALFPIPVILLHEICHMCGHINNDEYLRTILVSQLYPFYKYVISNLEPKTNLIPKEELMKTIIQLSREMDSVKGQGSIHNTYLLWFDYFNKVVNDTNSEFFANTIIGTYMYNIEDKNIIPKRNVETVTELLYKSYEKMGVKNSRRLMVGQELIIPSEVICVSNQWNPDRSVISLINNTIEGIKF